MKSSKVTQNSFLIALCLVVLVSRFYGLTFKPLHFDEGINGWFSSQVQRLGYYRYDPNNYHGPLYFYILRFFEIIFGKSIWTLRAVPTVFSMLSVLLFTTPVVGPAPWRRWLSFLLLISPAFIFFGRSGIHEMPFVFFQLVFAVGLLRSIDKKDATALSCLMIGLFGMITLKETFAVTLFSFTIGLLSLGTGKLKGLLKVREWQSAWNRYHLWLLSGLVFFFLIMFTGFFTNFGGIIDFFRAFLPWMKTGVQGNGHDKDSFYWILTLWRAEPLVLLGAVLAVAGLFSKNLPLRVISVFSLVQLAIYSAIPYKTVWCILSLVWGFYFVIGYYLVERLQAPARKGLWLAVALGAGFNLWSAYDSSYRNPIDMSHPYVYVNSTYDVTKVMDFLNANSSGTEKPRVQVGMVEQWPWPWLLRDFPIVTYDTCGKNPTPELDIYFCDNTDVAVIERVFLEPYWKMEFEFRQEKGSFSYLYLKKSVFPTVPFAKAQEVSGSPP